MIYNDMDLFNVAEVEKDSVLNGLRLYRYPKGVTKNIYGNFVAPSCKGSEIRFITEGSEIKITLRAVGQQGNVQIYKGDYFHSAYILKADEDTILNILEPERFGWVFDEALVKTRFSPNVWRVFIDTECIVLKNIDCSGYPVRPPNKHELPDKIWLAYGSSITHGVGAVSNANSYIQHAAKRLYCDVYNMGMSGTCYCEAEIADFFAQRDDWDFITLEIGVNMRSVFSSQEFKKRAEYLVDSLLNRHPGNPIIIISIFPNHAVCSKVGSPYTKHHFEYNEILNEIVSDRKEHKNLHLINGEDIVENFTYFTCDLIHPSEYGHIMMGERLANKLIELI